MINGHKRNTGFIALHRSIQEHWIWNDPVKLKWWVDILMTANHSDAKVNIGFGLMDCKRGQSLNSLQTWSKKWRVDVSTVRRFFTLLEKDKMIVTENAVKTTRLTVCNYDTYNGMQHVKQSQSKDETIRKQPEGNTNNNVNNSNNDNNEKQCVSETPAHNFSNEQLSIFKTYQDWISIHAPQAAKMKDPLTINQFISFQKKFPAPAGQKLLQKTLWALDNWDGLHKRRSLFKTMLWWIDNEKFDEEVIKLREHCKNQNKGLSNLSKSVREIEAENRLNQIFESKTQMVI